MEATPPRMTFRDAQHRVHMDMVKTRMFLLGLGSGTTLIAAEQLGRKCYGLEISPAYCDVIVNRWESLTGRKAERHG